MEINHEENNNKRRDFLKMGLTLGVGVLAGGGIVKTLMTEKANAQNKDTITLLSTDGKIVTVDSTQISVVQKEELLTEQQKRAREGMPGKKWVKVIDLSKCRNAMMCVATCKAAHQLKPEQFHNNVLRMKDSEHTQPYFMPVRCNQCDNPPCTKVCPVDATFKRQDGVVLIDNERCIGCRFCMAACPYSARSFNWLEPKELPGSENMVYDMELNVPQKKGTITKCLFSADKLRKGELPYCVSACPNGVYWFGDINEDAVTNGTTKETARFSELIRDNGGYTLMEELGTKPSVYYLPPKDRAFPFQYNGKTTLDTEEHS